ncbi:hypothetical protein [Paenibacillus radicis (ex Xue et al. 2023)]|uniref:Uncharacterized protein n=1 Tax=Paenibacillus radicis (ex Xue et al. 2023) TaxID=2972489 RepID=A0ABT1YJW2_9BACL|nr:hypothetical protein [Paenibacillus radicis (ex Xue et al. 2023)]MCR8633451.1 hypothetical protein [Paenibacillus radicis (ex Xue et al. 2023)]
MSEVVEIQDPHNWIPANTQGGQLFINVEQVAGVVQLNSIDNHIYQIEETGEWLITTDGYKACNKVAGVQCISPDSLLLPDGKTVSNPYVEFDQATGTAHRFWARHITIGKNSSGMPSIISVTILLDAKIAFAEELSRAIEKNKDAGRYYMAGTLSKDELKSGMYILFDGDMGIYGDRTYPEVVAAVQNFINNKRYGDKKAWTMALKTSLQRQPCMPPPKTRALNGFAKVLVAAYKSDFEEKDIVAMIREYTETGTVSGADVSETIGDISKERDTEDFKLLSDGGMRF